MIAGDRTVERFKRSVGSPTPLGYTIIDAAEYLFHCGYSVGMGVIFDKPQKLYPETPFEVEWQWKGNQALISVVSNHMVVWDEDKIWDPLALKPRRLEEYKIEDFWPVAPFDTRFRR